MVTLAQLRTFLAVARLNSFSRAAEGLHISQPAVSAQILALEDVLKAKLFDRIGKKIALSDAGRTVLAAAEDIVARLAEMERDLADLQQMKAGHLAIGASQVVGVYLLPELLAGFQQEFPGIQSKVRIELARRIVDMLVEGEIDCALIGEGVPVTDSRIAVKPIARDELVLIVPSHHILAEMASVPLSSLLEMPFILPRRDSASSECLLEQLAMEGMEPKIVMELGNIGAVKRAVEAGLGVSIVSRMAVEHELASGRLKSVSLVGLKLERRISLYWLHGKRFSRATEAFIGFANRHAQSATTRTAATGPAEPGADDALSIHAG